MDRHESGAPGPSEDRDDRPDPDERDAYDQPAASDPDDLEPLRTRASARARVWLAALVAAALVLPVGGWLLDERAFRTSGDAVTEALGDDAELADALLLVRSVGCAGTVSSGSAFAADLGDGPTIVTNRHVVEDAATVGVRPLEGGPAMEVAAHRLGDGADVAVLELADPDGHPSVLGRGSHPQVGDEVRLLGFPAAQPFTVTGTVVVAEPTVLVLDLPTAPGASGSPVLDAQGRVVGQVYARTPEGRGVATPVGLLAEAAADATPAPDC